jgi:hypothetical protein
MDISELAVNMHQVSLQSAVSTSVMKLAINSETETANQMTDMMSNMAVDTSKGTTIDAIV